MLLMSLWLFPLVSVMGKQILEISLIVEKRTKSVPLFIAVMSQSVRMSCFHTLHLIHEAKIIYKLIKPDWLLLGERGRVRGRNDTERGNMRGCTVNNLQIINRKINKT